MKGRIVLGIVVEGPTDQMILWSQGDWFREQGFDTIVIQAKGKQRMIADRRKHVDALRAKGCRYIAFLPDQHEDECPPRTAEQFNPLRDEQDVLVAVMARALEAWLLADSEALAKLGFQTSESSSTDSIDDPAGELKNRFLRARRHENTKSMIVRAFERRFSLDRAAQRNLSAKRFLDKLSALWSAS